MKIFFLNKYYIEIRLMKNVIFKPLLIADEYFYTRIFIEKFWLSAKFIDKCHNLIFLFPPFHFFFIFFFFLHTILRIHPCFKPKVVNLTRMIV